MSFLQEEFKSIKDQQVNVRYVGILSHIKKVMLAMQFFVTVCSNFQTVEYGGKIILALELASAAL